MNKFVRFAYGVRALAVGACLLVAAYSVTEPYTKRIVTAIKDCRQNKHEHLYH